MIKEGKSPEEADAIVETARGADGESDGKYDTQEDGTAILTDVDLAILDYARKLTKEPGSIETADVERLRASGMDDRAIHDLCSIVGYFAFANRIASGLGIDLESE